MNTKYQVSPKRSNTCMATKAIQTGKACGLNCGGFKREMTGDAGTSKGQTCEPPAPEPPEQINAIEKRG